MKGVSRFVGQNAHVSPQTSWSFSVSVRCFVTEKYRTARQQLQTNKD